MAGNSFNGQKPGAGGNQDIEQLIKSYTSKMLGHRASSQAPPPRKPQPENSGLPLPPVTPQPPQELLTDSLGHPSPGDDSSLTVGPGGPILMEDVYFFNKLAHFGRERIPPRVVHAKGAGAFGYFETHQSMEKYTMAGFLQRQGQRTRVFVRFSQAGGLHGSPDTARDIRGFAVKFYTEQGIYDLVSNHLPVFFLRDAIRFPDLFHALMPDPASGLPGPQRFWDFISLTPEATHMVTWLYSDRGLVKSYRHIDGFGVNTYIWVNKNGLRRFVKFHWKTQQGLQTIDGAEAQRLAGQDSSAAARDLYESIAAGEQPSYRLCVQLMDPAEADRLDFDPLDPTKTWPEAQYPLLTVGMLTLDRNPENVFAQVEQAAFSPANLVPGVEFSADKLLQGRSFIYHDAQRYRLGTNFEQLPVNRPINPVANCQQDGAMTYHYQSSPINYLPNSLAGNSPHQPTPPDIIGPFVEGYIQRTPIRKANDFVQAGHRWRSLGPAGQQHLTGAIACELALTRQDIQQRVIGYFHRADESFGTAVAQAVLRCKGEV